MVAPSISVARVLELRVPLHWEEAVALASAAEADCWAHGTPVSLDNCFISTAGEVRLDAGIPSPPGASISPMQLLRTLLDGQPVPRDVQALLATADDPLAGFPSEHDAGSRLRFDLGAFVRPGPAEDIAKLAARALEIDAQTTALAALNQRTWAARPEAPRQPAVVPSTSTALQQAVSIEGPPTRYVRLVQALRGRAAALGAAATVIAAVGAAAAWLPGLVSGATPAEPVDAVPSVESTTRAPATDTTVAGDIPLITGARKNGAPALAASPSSRAFPGRGRSRPSPRLTAEAVAASPVAPPDVAPLAARPEGQGLVAVPKAQPVVRIAPPAFGSVPAPPEVPYASGRGLRAAALDRRVYSAQDGGVEPPVSLRPHLPTEARADSEQSGSFIELLVNERGEVERVRLRQTDASINDRMIVAAAKAWRFRPATRDGQPVAYVLHLPVNR